MYNNENALICKEVFFKKAITKTLNRMVVYMYILYIYMYICIIYIYLSIHIYVCDIKLIGSDS